MMYVAPPPPSVDTLLDNAAAKVSGRRPIWRPPLSWATEDAGPAEAKETLPQVLRRVLPLVIPWIFVQRFSLAVRWVTAQDLSSAGEYEEALRIARSLPPQFRDWNRWKLFELQQLSLLSWHNEVIEKANTFLMQFIAKAPLTPTERYVKCYAQWCGRQAFEAISDSGPIPTAFQFDVTTIDLSLIRERWKRSFPMPIHPNWKD